MVTLIVDNTDRNIAYDRNWISTGTRRDFNGTSHQAYDGQSVSYTFRGTSINVVGTQGAGGLMSATFSIDGTQKGSWQGNPVTSSVFHIPFFQSGTLSDGEHTVVMTTHASGSSQTNLVLYLDYFEVNPGSDTSFTSNPGYVIYDDASSQFTYSGNANSQLLGPSNGFYEGSGHLLQSGSTVKFNFGGTILHIFGVLPSTTSGGPLATYQVDGQSPQLVSVSAPAANLAVNGVVSNNELFFIGPLSPGSHNVVITSQSNDLFYFDYALVDTYQWSAYDPSKVVGTASSGQSSTGAATATSGALSSSSVSTSSGKTTSTGTSVSGTSVPSATNTFLGDSSSSNATGASNSGASSSPSIVGPVVGGVIGGLVVIAALIFLILRYRKRKSATIALHDIDGISERAYPYPMTFTHGQFSGAVPSNNGTYPSDPYSDYPTKASLLESQTPDSGSHNVQYYPGPVSSSSNVPPSTVPPSSLSDDPVVHTDSGIRLAARRSEIPPTYSEA